MRDAPKDEGTPSALAEFMATGWAEDLPQWAGPAAVAPWCAARRRRLSDRFPGDWLVVPTGRPKVRANDTDYPFRPTSDFAWLTGHYEPHAVLVLAPAPSGHEAILFVPARADRSSPAFFADRRDGELWVGRRPGPEEVGASLSIAVAPLDELATTVKAAARAGLRLLGEVDDSVDRIVAEVRGECDPELDEELRRVLAGLRLHKDDYEVASLQAAVDATVRGFEDVVRALPEAVATSERWVEGTFRRRARTEGNDLAYGVIAAAGAHACTLHWERNDGPVRLGDLLLLDAGVESHDLYAADVTRTLPVSGRFGEAQREVYEVVWSAQQAALAECTPGNDFGAPHRAAMRVIAAWLVDKGLLRCSLDEALGEPTAFHRRFTLHGTSHMLGLDVHDCAAARNEHRQAELRPGMVLTVEPGCYFQPDDLTVPEAYRGIGVRIEDDVLITDDGHRVLSAALPTQADEVERWMASLRASTERNR